MISFVKAVTTLAYHPRGEGDMGGGRGVGRGRYGRRQRCVEREIWEEAEVCGRVT